MDNAKIAETLIKHTKDIATIEASAKSAHYRLDDMQVQIKAVHELSQSVAQLAGEVRNLTKKLDGTIGDIKESLKDQGGRIGGFEKTIERMDFRVETLESQKSEIKSLDEKIDHIEQKPGKKWEKITWQIITAIVSAVAMYFMIRYFGIGIQGIEG